MKKWIFGIAAVAVLVWALVGRWPLLTLNPARVSWVVITTNGEGPPPGRIVITDKQDIRKIASTLRRAYRTLLPNDGCLYSMDIQLVTPGKNRTVTMAVCCYGGVDFGYRQYGWLPGDARALRQVLAKYGFVWIP